MKSRLKPLPKTGAEGVQDQLIPYSVEKSTTDPALEINRGNDISLRKEEIKDFTVGLEDHDSAVLYYFNNVIKPYVIQNGTKITVPTVYENQELWKSVQADGYVRDKDAKLMAPMIMFKRESFSKNRELGNKLDGNKAHLYQIFEKKYSKRNMYDRFSVLTDRIPVKEYIVTVVPDYITITYSCVVFTEYVEQMNRILESINYASDSYWGDLNRFKFKARIDDFSNTIEFAVGEDRGVKSTFNIVLNGYIISEALNKELSTIKKIYSKSVIVFTLETTLDDLSEVKNIQGKPKEENQNKMGIGIKSPIGNTSLDSFNINLTGQAASINEGYALYLAVAKELTASSTTSLTATFASGWLLAPDPLPATSVESFVFFANGQYIERSAITSFVDNGSNTSTLTINLAELGFTLTDKEIVGIGKFI